MTGSSSTIVEHPLPANHPLQRKSYISLARARLGSQPNVALDAGLERTIAYFAKLAG